MQRFIAYTWRHLPRTLEKEFPMTDRPNVLVVCLDQMRQDFFSLHGHPVVRTPPYGFHRWLRGELYAGTQRMPHLYPCAANSDDWA